MVLFVMNPNNEIAVYDLSCDILHLKHVTMHNKYSINGNSNSSGSDGDGGNINDIVNGGGGDDEDVDGFGFYIKGGIDDDNDDYHEYDIDNHDNSNVTAKPALSKIFRMDQLFTPIATTTNTTPRSDGRTRLDKAFEMLHKEQASHDDDTNINNNINKAPNLSGTLQSILNLLKYVHAIHPGLEDFNEVMVNDNYVDSFISNDDLHRSKSNSKNSICYSYAGGKIICF